MPVSPIPGINPSDYLTPESGRTTYVPNTVWKFNAAKSRMEFSLFLTGEHVGTANFYLFRLIKQRRSGRRSWQYYWGWREVEENRAALIPVPVTFKSNSYLGLGVCTDTECVREPNGSNNGYSQVFKDETLHTFLVNQVLNIDNNYIPKFKRRTKGLNSIYNPGGQQCVRFALCDNLLMINPIYFYVRTVHGGTVLSLN